MATINYLAVKPFKEGVLALLKMREPQFRNWLTLNHFTVSAPTYENGSNVASVTVTGVADGPLVGSFVLKYDPLLNTELANYFTLSDQRFRLGEVTDQYLRMRQSNLAIAAENVVITKSDVNALTQRFTFTPQPGNDQIVGPEHTFDIGQYSLVRKGVFDSSLSSVGELPDNQQVYGNVASGGFIPGILGSGGECWVGAATFHGLYFDRDRQPDTGRGAITGFFWNAGTTDAEKKVLYVLWRGGNFDIFPKDLKLSVGATVQQFVLMSGEVPKRVNDADNWASNYWMRFVAEDDSLVAFTTGNITVDLTPIPKRAAFSGRVNIYGDGSKSVNTPWVQGSYSGLKKVEVMNGDTVLSTVMASDFIDANVLYDQAVMFGSDSEGKGTASLNLVVPAEATHLRLEGGELYMLNMKWNAYWGAGESAFRSANVYTVPPSAEATELTEILIPLKPYVDKRPVLATMSSDVTTDLRFAYENERHVKVIAGAVEGSAVIGFGLNYGLGDGDIVNQNGVAPMLNAADFTEFELAGMWHDSVRKITEFQFLIPLGASTGILPDQIRVNGRPISPKIRYGAPLPSVESNGKQLVTLRCDSFSLTLVNDRIEYVAFSRESRDQQI